MEKIKTKAEEYGMCGGIHVVEPNPKELQQRIDEGYRFIAYSLDTRMLDFISRDALSTIKNIPVKQ